MVGVDEGASAEELSSTRSGIPADDLFREPLDESDVLEDDFSLVEEERCVCDERCFLSFSLSRSPRSLLSPLSPLSPRSAFCDLDSFLSILRSGLLSLGFVGMVAHQRHG